MNGCGTIGIFWSFHLVVVLLSSFEYGGDVIFDFEVIGDPPFLMKKLWPALPLPGAHLQ